MKRFIIAGIIVAVVLAGLWHFGRPAYRRARETRALEQANKYLAKGDYANASLSARQALEFNPNNAEACRIMADLAEKARSPYVLDYRRRLVELAPTVQNKLLLASTALRVQEAPYPLAAQTLDDLKATAGNVANYHTVRAELALRLKQFDAAAAEFQQAIRLEPTNELNQLNVAVLQLQSTNASSLTTARATLERLRASTNVGPVALRWLVADSLGRNDLAAASKFSAELLADRRATLDDRLQHLTILQRSKNPDFQAYLSGLQRNALTNAPQVYGISSWMIGHNLTVEALTWLTNCPAKLRTEQPVPLAMADCYLSLKDWQGLDTWLQDQKWGDLEFLRFALLSRASGELRQRLAADADWRSAVRLAGDRLGPMTALLGMATSWGRTQAREDLLWQIAQRFPRERWTLTELERLCYTSGNTRGLNRVYTAMVSYSPTNFVAQNNLAATSLLLRTNMPDAHKLAKEVFEKHPDQPVVISTYALSLYLQGRSKDGLAAMQKLKPEDLASPSVALYYGLLLAANGETNKAGKYFDIAQKSSLLPEEKTLAAGAIRPPGSGT
jgi:Tfp pilus assembly protein PilF